MASKVNKRYSASAKGVLEQENGKLFLEVEDVAKPLDLAEFLNGFIGLEVLISVAHKEDLDGDEN